MNNDALESIMSLIADMPKLKPYAERCVKNDHWDDDGIESRLSTAEGIGYKKYESCFFSEHYVKNLIPSLPMGITLEAYDTKEEAEAGHNRWLEILKNKPEILTGIINRPSAEKLLSARGSLEFRRVVPMPSSSIFTQ